MKERNEEKSPRVGSTFRTLWRSKKGKWQMKERAAIAVRSTSGKHKEAGVYIRQSTRQKRHIYSWRYLRGTRYKNRPSVRHVYQQA